jgi:hypothetical protein
MIWARRRTESGPGGGRSRRTGLLNNTDGSEIRVAIIDLGQGQTAVIFDEPAVGPAPRRTGPGAPLSAAHEITATAEAICEAVTAAVEAAGHAEAAGPRAGANPPPGAGLWSRVRARRAARRRSSHDSS